MRYLFALLVVLCCVQCSPKSSPSPAKSKDPVIPNPSAYKALTGADISWITEMEANGRVFYNNAGEQQDLHQILKGYGMSVIRLRVWVNPADGYCGIRDVMAKAQRAKDAGMKIMIDFHYSDWWADPSKQNKPAAWEALSFTQLKAALYNHTFSVLDTLKKSGINVAYAQVGNETKDGMLWPDGRASTNMDQYADILDTGYAAVKAVDPATQSIIHLDNGWDNGLYRWQFDALTAREVRYDIIGMSLYPPAGQSESFIQQFSNNVNDCVTRYGKPVFLVELGMPENEPAECRSFIATAKAVLEAVPNKMGIGLLYWEPQSHDWKGYKLNAWNPDGKPSDAMEGFR